MPRKNTGARLFWRARRNVYEIVWYQGGRRCSRSTGTSDRLEAEKTLGKWVHQQEQNRPGPRHPAELRIADVLTAYADARAERASAATIGYHIAALVRWWGARTCDEITAPVCAAYVRERGRSITTARGELKVLQTALNYALDRGTLSRKIRVDLPPAPPPRERWLTRGEVARLLWQARRTPHLATFIMLALYTAGRKEALFQIRWPQVDFAAGVIDLRGDRAGGKGRARNPMPRPLRLWLTRMRRYGSETGYVIQFRGRPIGRIDKAFRQATQRAGLDDVTPHTLRHTCATWLAQRGVDMWEIAGWLGHTDIKTTQRYYAHHSPHHKRKALEALEN